MKKAFTLLKEKDDDKELYGILDENQKLITEVIYEAVGEFSSGLIPVKKDVFWGFLDEDYKLTIEHKFYDVGHFEENSLCPARINEKPGSWALINKQGEVAAYAPNYYDGKPYGFYQISPFNGREVTIARYYGVYVLINKKGEIVSDYYTNLYFSEKSNAFIGERRAPLIVIDANKNKLFEPKRSYSDIYYPNKKLNRIHAQFEQKSLFLDFEGNEIIAPSEYTIYMHSDDGLAEFEDTNGLYGYMDLDGNIVIEPQYTSAETFVHGLALVKKDDKLFYINEKNVKQFNMDFLSAETFSLSGIAKVRLLNKKEAFINIHGEFYMSMMKKI